MHHLSRRQRESDAEKQMPNTEFLIKLRELHEELSAINDDLNSAEQVDEEAVDALGQLVTDVSGLVDHAREINGPEENVAERYDLQDRILQFDTDHPRVTRFLSQLTDLLAMMGI
jgi:hypothetical protein